MPILFSKLAKQNVDILAHMKAGTPAKLPSTPLNLQSIYQGTCLTKDGQRKIDYHIFEIEVAKKDLDENW